jgi:hypothetical protein
LQHDLQCNLNNCIDERDETTKCSCGLDELLALLEQGKLESEQPAEAKAIDYQQPDNKTYPSIEQPAALKSKNFIVCCECLDMAKREVEKLK